MPEKYNPLKSAELSGEQNYNMIDGILNNAVAPLPQPPEKPMDKVPGNAAQTPEPGA